MRRSCPPELAPDREGNASEPDVPIFDELFDLSDDEPAVMLLVRRKRGFESPLVRAILTAVGDV